MLYGSVSSFGNYDECLDAVAYETIETNVQETADDGDDDANTESRSTSTTSVMFRGKYCAINYTPMKPKSYQPDYLANELPKGKTFRKMLGEFTPIEIGLGLQAARTRFGYCFPSKCSIDDIKKLGRFLNEHFHVNGTLQWCHTKEDVSRIGPKQLSILIILTTMTSIVILATYVDYRRTSYDMKESDQSSFPMKLFVSISAMRTYHRLSKTETFDPRFTFLYGFRFLSLLWVLYAHTYVLQNILSVGNTIKLRYVPQEFFFQLFMNGTLSAESFFFISGFIVSLFMVNSLKTKETSMVGKQFWVNFLTCYVSRIWRQTPVLVFVIGIAVVWPIVGSGPIWKETLDVMTVNCRNNWFPTIAFFSNFEKPAEMVSLLFFILYFVYHACQFQMKITMTGEPFV